MSFSIKPRVKFFQNYTATKRFPYSPSDFNRLNISIITYDKDNKNAIFKLWNQNFINNLFHVSIYSTWQANICKYNIELLLIIFTRIWDQRYKLPQSIQFTCIIIIAFITDMWCICNVSGTFIFVAVVITAFKLKYGYFYGHATDMAFPFSVIITAIGGCMSVLAAVFIFMAEICTCPWWKLASPLLKAIGTRGCVRICTAHMQKENNYEDSDRQQSMNSKSEVGASDEEEDAVFQCCTYHVVYANRKMSKPDGTTY